MNPQMVRLWLQCMHCTAGLHIPRILNIMIIIKPALIAEYARKNCCDAPQESKQFMNSQTSIQVVSVVDHLDTLLDTHGSLAALNTINRIAIIVALEHMEGGGDEYFVGLSWSSSIRTMI
eukprot:704709_1